MIYTSTNYAFCFTSSFVTAIFCGWFPALIFLASNNEVENIHEILVYVYVGEFIFLKIFIE